MAGGAKKRDYEVIEVFCFILGLTFNALRAHGAQGSVPEAGKARQIAASGDLHSLHDHRSPGAIDQSHAFRLTDDGSGNPERVWVPKGPQK